MEGGREGGRERQSEGVREGEMCEYSSQDRAEHH